jgi:hypothetical protein
MIKVDFDAKKKKGIIPRIGPQKNLKFSLSGIKR